MRKYIGFALLLLIPIITRASSDSTTVSTKWGLKLSGYINPHLWVDTRQTVGGRDGELILWPEKPVYDANGHDTSAAPSANMLAITTRFGMLISAPDILNAKASGYFEADFSGSIDLANNSLRLRHGYIQLDWGKHKLLFGQYWHPLVVAEIMPVTAPLNTGAPFHPYARHMQLRYTTTLNSFLFYVAAIYQRDNASDGPFGTNPKYLKNAVLPNLHAQLQYNKGPWFLGIAGDLKTLKPRLVAKVNDSVFYKTSTLIHSFTATAFGKYAFSNWDVKFQTLFAQNQSENSMLGGYAESPLQPDHTYKYTNSNTFSCWLNIAKTSGKWRPVLFAGYSKNLGFSEELQPNSLLFGRGLKGNGIDYLWRIQPRLLFFASERFQIYTDIEYTVAAFGNGDPDSKGLYTSSSSIANTRFMFGVVFTY